LGLIFVFAVNGLAVFLLRAAHSIRFWNMARLGPYVLWLVILISAQLRHDTRPDHLALAFLATYACYAGVLVFLVRHRLAGYWRPRFRLACEMLKYGIPVATASMPQLLNQRVDQLIVVSFLSIEDLGYYAVATSWASATSLAASAIASVVFPRISGAAPERRTQLLKKALATTAGVTVATAFVLAASGARLIPLVFGPRFLAAVPVSYFLLAASTFRAISDSLGAGLKGMGFPSGVMAAELSGVLVSLPLLGMLVPRLSLIGAGLAAIAGAAVSCAVGVALLVRRSNADLRPSEA
jgi:O-antigen/teichoic acid export membrane protein